MDDHLAPVPASSQLTARDAKTADALFRAYGGRLFAYFHLMLASESGAKRALSDTLMAAVADLGSPGGQRDLDQYAPRLFTLARTECHKYQSAEAVDAGRHWTSSGSPVLADVARQAVAWLAPDVREAYILSNFDNNLTLPQLAEVLGASLDAAADLRAQAGLDFVRAVALCAKEAGFSEFVGADLRIRAEESLAADAAETPPPLPILPGQARADARSRAGGRDSAGRWDSGGNWDSASGRDSAGRWDSASGRDSLGGWESVGGWESAGLRMARQTPAPQPPLSEQPPPTARPVPPQQPPWPRQPPRSSGSAQPLPPPGQPLPSPGQGLPPVPPLGQGLPPVPPLGQGLPPVPPLGQGLPPVPPLGQGLPPVPPPGQGPPPAPGSPRPLFPASTQYTTRSDMPRPAEFHGGMDYAPGPDDDRVPGTYGDRGYDGSDRGYDGEPDYDYERAGHDTGEMDFGYEPGYGGEFGDRSGRRRGRTVLAWTGGGIAAVAVAVIAGQVLLSGSGNTVTLTHGAPAGTASGGPSISMPPVTPSVTRHPGPSHSPTASQQPVSGPRTSSGTSRAQTSGGSATVPAPPAPAHTPSVAPPTRAPKPTPRPAPPTQPTRPVPSTSISMNPPPTAPSSPATAASG